MRTRASHVFFLVLGLMAIAVLLCVMFGYVPEKQVEYTQIIGF